MSFGKKKEKELLGLNLYKKLKDVKYSKDELKLNGMRMEH